MQDLKNYIKQYREIDNELRDLNRVVYAKREARRVVETEITEIIKAPEFAGFKKVRLEEDGSTITIKRPNEWTKAWTLSQKDLKELLAQYFASNQTASPDEIFQFIVETKKKTLVANEFSFSRTVPGENEN
jgi:hypothetical protein